MHRLGRARCGLVLIVVIGVLLARADAAAASGLPVATGTGATLQRWGHDALSVLGGIGLLALALLGFITAALLAAVILLRIPPVTAAARWLSKLKISAVDLYTPRLSRWLWKPVAHVFIRLFVWLLGLRVRVEDFKASDGKDATAHQLNAVVRSVLGSGGVTLATGTSWLVTTPLGSAGLLADMADALRDVPQGKWIAAALRLINKLIPRDAFTVAGDLLPAGSRGPGLALSLSDRNGDTRATETLWSADYDLSPDNQTPDTPTPTNAPDLLARLGVAGGAWTIYAALQQRQNTVRFSTLGSTRWRSYAWFRAGLEAHRCEQLALARVLYAKAVDEDGANDPALANLARLELQAGELAIAAARLQRVMDDTRDVEATRFRRFLNKTHDERLNQTQTNERRRLLRDTLWYQAAYNMAVAQLEGNDAGSAVWTNLDLCCELESALADLRQHHTPRVQAEPIEALLRRLRGPSMVLLAESVRKGLPALDANERQRLHAKLRDLGRRVLAPGDRPPQATIGALMDTLVMRFRDDPTATSLTRYNVSSYDTAVRSYDDAITQLRLAVSGSPDIIARAKTDPSLEDLRTQRHKDFLDAIGEPLPPPLWKRLTQRLTPTRWPWVTRRRS